MTKIGAKEKQLRAMREQQVEKPEGFEAHRRKVDDAIRRGRRAFEDLGRALKEIRDSKSFRERYDTFEACCREEWGIGKGHAYRLIQGADVMALLDAPEDSKGVETSPTGDKTTDTLPETERQTRALAGLGEEAAKEAWERATTEAGGQPTAQQVKDAVEHVKQQHAGPDEVCEEPDQESPTPSPAPEPDHQPDEESELVRALEENARLHDVVDALEDGSAGKKLAALTEKYARLEARLNQALRTSKELERTATYTQGELRKIRDELGVERNQDILPAIREMRGAAA